METHEGPFGAGEKVDFSKNENLGDNPGLSDLEAELAQLEIGNKQDMAMDMSKEVTPVTKEMLEASVAKLQDVYAGIARMPGMESDAADLSRTIANLQQRIAGLNN